MATGAGLLRLGGCAGRGDDVRDGGVDVNLIEFPTYLE